MDGLLMWMLLIVLVCSILWRKGEEEDDDDVKKFKSWRDGFLGALDRASDRAWVRIRG